MKQLTSKESKFSQFINNPRTASAVAFGKKHWRDIGMVIAVLLIVDDVDMAAEMVEGSFVVDIMTAQANGVI